MKKTVFALVVLLFAAPTWATVTITVEQIHGTDEVEILYVSDGNLPRAFGLDITVPDGNIVACTPAMEGECTVSVRGYGIFPGTIDIDDTQTPPVVMSYGTPVAPSGARGALGGLGTNGITIEMASLYEGPNAPPLSGLLCTIVVTTEMIEPCTFATVNIAGNTVRRGVVMEDSTEVVTVVYVPGTVPSPTLTCFPCEHPDSAEWVAVGIPDCWCYPRQCHGDATGEELASNPKSGYFYVGASDLGLLLAAWKVLEPAVFPIPSGPGIGSVPGGICADFDHQQEGNPKSGYFRVGAGDLGILLTNWKILEPAVFPIPSGPGIPPDCLDLP